MISHDLKCIFFHVTRTAGKSVEEKIFCTPPVYGSSDHSAPNDSLLNKSITQDEFDEYFKFAFVRNTWDRVLSSFTHSHEYRYNIYGKSFIEIRKLFKEYVFNLPKPYLENGVWLPKETPVRTQLHWTTLNGKGCLDFIGSFENLNQDFNKIRNKLLSNIDDLDNDTLINTNKEIYTNNKNCITKSKFIELISGDLPHHNSSNRKPHSLYYDKDTINHVNEIFEDEINYFNFKFFN